MKTIALLIATAFVAAGNTLPPSWENTFDCDNTLPPTWENTLPPTFGLYISAIEA
jgi:hypothetical protein